MLTTTHKIQVHVQRLFVSLITLMAVTSSQISLAKDTTDIANYHRVIIVKASTLLKLKEYQISEYSVAAMKHNNLEPIPFQFDEMAENDYVHIDKAKTELLGKENYYDRNDELLFMYRDAGPKRGKTKSRDGKVLAEIKIEVEGQKAKYVYVLQGARIRSEDDYVRYSAELGRTETEYYALQVNNKNAYMWEDFNFRSYEGKHAERPLDTIKLFGKTRVIPMGMMKFELNNKHMVAKVLAEKAGPIRATTTFKAVLTYLKLPLFNTSLQVRHYENKIVYDAIFKIPGMRRQLLAGLEIRLSMDGNELEGAETVFAHAPDTISIVDDGLNQFETDLTTTELSHDETLWTWIDSKDSFAMLSVYKFEQLKSGEDNTKNQATVLPWYEDSMKKKVKPEYFKGQSPNIGYAILLPRFGAMRLRSTHNMYSESIDGTAANLASSVIAEPVVSVSY